MSQYHLAKPPAVIFRHATDARGDATVPVGGDAQAADAKPPVVTTKLAQANVDVPARLASRLKRVTGESRRRWQFRKRDILSLRKGRYGPIYPKTPANYGFTIIAKIKPGARK